MHEAEPNASILDRVRAFGRVGSLLVMGLGIVLAISSGWLSHQANTHRDGVQVRVGWMVALAENQPLATILEEIRETDTVGPDLRALADAAPTTDEPALRTRLQAAIRAENRALSMELSRLWDLTTRVLFGASALVGLAALVIYLEQTDLLGRLGVARRRWSEAETRVQERTRILTAFESGPFSLHLFTADGRPLRSVPNITRRRGLRPFDFVAQGIADVRDHPVLTAIGGNDAFNRAVAGETVLLPARSLTLPVEPPVPDGHQTIWVATVFLPIRDPSGAVQQVLALSWDETDRKRLHADLRRAERLAEVGTLAAGVAHEINNPLTFLTMNASILADLMEDETIDREAVRGLLHDIGHGVKRIQGVTRELSDIAHTATDPMEPVDLHDLVERTVHMCRFGLPEGIDIEVDLPALPTVQASSSRLAQVITNLVQNAARAMVDGSGTIRVEGGNLPDKHCWISVTDDGVGMSDEVKSRMFEPFYTTRRGGHGTGLGLYLVRCYAEELGGTIDAQSTLGEGTTMRLTLPIDTDVWFDSIKADAFLRLLVVGPTRAAVDRVRELLPEVETVVHASDAEGAIHHVRERPGWDRILATDPRDLTPLRSAMGDPGLRRRVVALPGGELPADRATLEHILDLRSHAPPAAGGPLTAAALEAPLGVRPHGS